MGYSETGFYSFITWLSFFFLGGGAASDYVVLATLKLRDLSAFASYVLKLKVCVIMPGFLPIFKKHCCLISYRRQSIKKKTERKEGRKEKRKASICVKLDNIFGKTNTIYILNFNFLTWQLQHQSYTLFVPLILLQNIM